MVILFIILIVLFGIPVIHGIIDGWNGTTKYRRLYGLEDIETIEEENEVSEEDTMLNEITHLKILIDRNKLSSSYIQKELELTYNEKRRVTLLSKLNNLDRQTFNYITRIDKLLKKLE